MSLRYGNLGNECAHLCVDMQRLFLENTPWHLEWLPRILPSILKIAQSHAHQTIFTRFIPMQHAGQGKGMWKRYYEKWEQMTIERLGEPMLDLIPECAALVPPATFIDKHVYSPWLETNLHHQLQERRITTLVITGGETEVCVLATVLSAIDYGYRTIIVTDALCSSSDQSHDAQLEVYQRRYGVQVETAKVDEVIAAWK